MRSDSPEFHRLAAKELNPAQLFASASPLSVQKYKNFVFWTDEPFLIKVSQEETNLIAHEAEIGFVLNQLQVPTFSYVYRLLRMGAPLVYEDVSVFDVGPYDVDYLIIEKVEGVSLSKFVDDCSEQELMDVVVQVVNAIQVAHKRFGFVHGDLHAENVLVQRREELFSVPIGRKFLHTRVMAKIIDYDMSSLPAKKAAITHSEKEFIATTHNQDLIKFFLMLSEAMGSRSFFQELGDIRNWNRDEFPDVLSRFKFKTKPLPSRPFDGTIRYISQDVIDRRINKLLDKVPRGTTVIYDGMSFRKLTDQFLLLIKEVLTVRHVQQRLEIYGVKLSHRSKVKDLKKLWSMLQMWL